VLWNLYFNKVHFYTAYCDPWNPDIASKWHIFDAFWCLIIKLKDLLLYSLKHVLQTSDVLLHFQEVEVVVIANALDYV